MVSLGELHFVTLGIVIWRVTVEERVRAVILCQQTFKVFVLYDHVFEPAGTAPYICEEVPYIARLSAEGLARAAEAVTDELVIVSCSAHVPSLGVFEKQRFYSLGMKRREVFVRQLKFYCEVLVVKLLTL